MGAPVKKKRQEKKEKQERRDGTREREKTAPLWATTC